MWKPREDLTQLLRHMSNGDISTQERVFTLVYRDLRPMAVRLLAEERSDPALQPTALVHEAFLRLLSSGEIEWESSAHFFAVSARIMRRILVDHARARDAWKRGGPQGEPMVQLDAALKRLAQ